MVFMVRESQGKIRRSGNVGEFYILKSGKNKRVRASQGKSKYQGAKVNKNAEKSLNCCTQTALADYFCIHFLICFSTLVSSVIASDRKMTLVFRMNRQTHTGLCSKFLVCFCVSVKVKLTVPLLCVCVHSAWIGHPQNDLHCVGRDV